MTKREIRTFLSQLSLAPANSLQQRPKKHHPIATFWKSSSEIRNSCPQLSQKRPVKSWGEWLAYRPKDFGLILKLL